MGHTTKERLKVWNLIEELIWSTALNWFVQQAQSSCGQGQGQGCRRWRTGWGRGFRQQTISWEGKFEEPRQEKWDQPEPNKTRGTMNKIVGGFAGEDHWVRTEKGTFVLLTLLACLPLVFTDRIIPEQRFFVTRPETGCPNSGNKNNSQLTSTKSLHQSRKFGWCTVMIIFLEVRCPFCLHPIISWSTPGIHRKKGTYKGYIDLLTTFWTKEAHRTLLVTYILLDAGIPYNVITGRRTLNQLEQWSQHHTWRRNFQETMRR